MAPTIKLQEFELGLRGCVFWGAYRDAAQQAGNAPQTVRADAPLALFQEKADGGVSRHDMAAWEEQEKLFSGGQETATLAQRAAAAAATLAAKDKEPLPLCTDTDTVETMRQAGLQALEAVKALQPQQQRQEGQGEVEQRAQAQPAHSHTVLPSDAGGCMAGGEA